MPRSTFTWFTTVLLATVMLVASCANLPVIDPPDMSVIGVEIEEATVLEQKYRIRVRIQNPNDYDLAVTGMKYELELNGEPFLKGVSDQAFIVPRYSQAVTDVSGVSTIFGFVRQIQALQDGTVEALSYRLTGKLSIRDRLLRLPFSYEGRLALRQPGPI